MKVLVVALRGFKAATPSVVRPFPRGHRRRYFRLSKANRDLNPAEGRKDIAQMVEARAGVMAQA